MKRKKITIGCLIVAIIGSIMFMGILFIYSDYAHEDLPDFNVAYKAHLVDGQFVPIKRIMLKAIGSDNRTVYSEIVLVNNPPKDKLLLKRMMLEYRKVNGFPMDSVILDRNSKMYAMSFYKYTPKTAYFIDNESYYAADGEKFLWSQDQDYLGGVYSDRSESDTTAWITHVLIAIQNEAGYSVERYTINNDFRIIELPKLTKIDRNQYLFKVLINEPPQNLDTLKRVMVDYFQKKEMYLNSINPDFYVRYVDFYNMTRETSYYIAHEETPSGWSMHVLDDCNELIGSISTRNRCNNNASSRIDVLQIFKKNKDTIQEIARDMLYLSCGRNVINNWHKYE